MPSVGPYSAGGCCSAARRLASAHSDVNPCAQRLSNSSMFVWLASFGVNRIEWRGSTFTLEKGRMIPIVPRRET